MAAPLLEVEGLDVAYGQMEALRGVSLRVDTAEIVGVIGPNGAGKSTLLGAIAGGVAAKAGTIRLDGQNVRGVRAEDLARAGLSLVPEGRHVFASLSVLENLKIGSFLRLRGAAVGAEIERVLHYFPRLRERLHLPAGGLSGGEQQMLVIGRALMTKPRLLMVDEPSLGLAPKIVEQIYEILGAMRKEEGLTILLNEQSSVRILKRCDRVYVLRNAQVQLEGRAADLADGEAIKAAYFGFHKDAVPATVGAAHD